MEHKPTIIKSVEQPTKTAKNAMQFGATVQRRLLSLVHRRFSVEHFLKSTGASGAGLWHALAVGDRNG